MSPHLVSLHWLNLTTAHPLIRCVLVKPVHSRLPVAQWQENCIAVYWEGGIGMLEGKCARCLGTHLGLIGYVSYFVGLGLILGSQLSSVSMRGLVSQ